MMKIFKFQLTYMHIELQLKTKETLGYYNMISTYLSNGESSKLYKKIVDEKKMALAAQAANAAMEDYGMYFIFCLPMGENNYG